MRLMGIGDECANLIDGQIKAAQTIGWDAIELRGVQVEGFDKGCIHDIPDAAFDIVEGKLKEAGIEAYAFGSTIMNWQKTVETPFETTLGEVERCIPRMKQLGTKFVRIMSLKPGDEEDSTPDVVFDQLNEVVKRFKAEGLQPVHENCMNYGGMSWKHAEEMIQNVPDLKWLFDTANPIFNDDRMSDRPWGKQDPWVFWEHMRDHTAHIHIKDAIWNDSKNDADYHFPGEGHGRVYDILKDAASRGYDGGVSIEPHMVVVYHDTGGGANKDQAMFDNFVEYGTRLKKIVGDIQSELATAS